MPPTTSTSREPSGRGIADPSTSRSSSVSIGPKWRPQWASKTMRISTGRPNDPPTGVTLPPLAWIQALSETDRKEYWPAAFLSAVAVEMIERHKPTGRTETKWEQSTREDLIKHESKLRALWDKNPMTQDMTCSSN